jgi:hypothetical protein
MGIWIKFENDMSSYSRSIDHSDRLTSFVFMIRCRNSCGRFQDLTCILRL